MLYFIFHLKLFTKVIAGPSRTDTTYLQLPSVNLCWSDLRCNPIIDIELKPFKYGVASNMNNDASSDVCKISDTKEVSDSDNYMKKQRKQQSIQKYLLITFIIVFTFQYPYVLKLIRSLLRYATQYYITTSEESTSQEWLVIIYKYMSYFIFENKFSGSCSGNLLSSVSRTGF